MAKTAIEGAARGTVFMIQPSRLKLVDDPHHPLYDERVKLPLDEAFVRNIGYYGIREPVLIAKEGDDLLVVAGRQRVRAALTLNSMLAAQGKVELLVPCLLQRGDEADLLGIAVSENEQRQADTPFCRARKAQRMLAMVGSPGVVAIAFGVSEKTLEQWLSLLTLAPAVRKAIEAGELSSSAALRLVGRSAEEQIAALEELKLAPPPTDGRQRAQSARRVAAAVGDSVPKMKTRRATENRLKGPWPRDYKAALLWVLGREE